MGRPYNTHDRDEKCMQNVIGNCMERRTVVRYRHEGGDDTKIDPKK
jgi:hypothetical protein